MSKITFSHKWKNQFSRKIIPQMKNFMKNFLWKKTYECFLLPKFFSWQLDNNFWKYSILLCNVFFFDLTVIWNEVERCELSGCQNNTFVREGALWFSASLAIWIRNHSGGGDSFLTPCSARKIIENWATNKMRYFR